VEKVMSEMNDTSKLGRAPQVRELPDDEVEEVSGGKNGAIVVADFNWSVRRSDGGRS
jgi:hypothetical protein